MCKNVHTLLKKYLIAKKKKKKKKKRKLTIIRTSWKMAPIGLLDTGLPQTCTLFKSRNGTEQCA